MRSYIVFAALAGIAWGFGGYFEKTGLQALKIPSILGITLRSLIALIILGILSIPAWKTIQKHSDIRYWIMIIIGGGIIAGSLGMWSFYHALSLSENLGITLAIAFALSPVAGIITGMIRGDQKFDIRIGIGITAIIIGIVLIQLSHKKNE